MNISIATRIKKYREAAGMTQQEFADKLGYSRSLINHWENGLKRVDGDQLTVICKVLRCTPNDLLL